MAILDPAVQENLSDFNARFHPRTLEPEQARMRDALFNTPTLTYLALLELGCFVGAFPPSLPPETAEDVLNMADEETRAALVSSRSLLGLLAVQRARRGEGPVSTVDPLNVFLHVLDVLDSIRFDTDLIAFWTWVTQASIRTGTDTHRLPQEMRARLTDPEQLALLTLISADDENRQYGAEIRGFFRLIEYVHDLMEMLGSLEACRITRSGVWHVHGSLFGAIHDNMFAIHEFFMDLGAVELRRRLEESAEHRDANWIYRAIAEQVDDLFSMFDDFTQGWLRISAEIEDEFSVSETREPIDVSSALVDHWKRNGAPGSDEGEPLRWLAPDTEVFGGPPRFNDDIWLIHWEFERYVSPDGTRLTSYR